MPPDSTPSLVPRLHPTLVGSNLILLVLLNAQTRTFEIRVGKLAFSIEFRKINTK